MGSEAALEPVPEDWSRALCVVAHPDDLEYGAAAVVARWTRQGKDVGYVLATRGEAGIDGLPPAETGPLREAEELASAAVVGVDDVVFLDHVDGLVVDGLDLRRDIAEQIRRFRPDVVVTMNFDLTWGGVAVNHADHRSVGLATLDAVRHAANRWLDPGLGEPWGGVRFALVAGAPTASHYVDVSATLESGIESLRLHRAYIDGLGSGFDPDDFLRSNAKRQGEMAGIDHAVTFRLYEA